MSTTIADAVASASASGITDIVVTRVWPSVATATATFSNVYPGQIGEFSPNVARAAEDDVSICAWGGALYLSDPCQDPSPDNEAACVVAGGLVQICGTTTEEELMQSIEDLKNDPNFEENEYVQDLNTRAADDEYSICAWGGALHASDGCIDPEDKDLEAACLLAGGLVQVCTTTTEEELLKDLDKLTEDHPQLKDLKSVQDLEKLKSRNKRSFLASYDGWCNSFDDSPQAQEEDPYTKKLLAEGAAGFFGVDIETDEQRDAWFKIGVEFHDFYCGDEGGARDLWKLVSSVEPWNELAAATSVPITLVFEGGETITPISTPTPTPTPTPEPTIDALEAIKNIGLHTSADDQDEEDDSVEPNERYFDFDANTWLTSLLTLPETPYAAETGTAERAECPFCDAGTGVTVDTRLLGAIIAAVGLILGFGM